MKTNGNFDERKFDLGLLALYEKLSIFNLVNPSEIEILQIFSTMFTFLVINFFFIFVSFLTLIGGLDL